MGDYDLQNAPSMFRDYIRGIGANALHSSWRAVNGLAGAAIAGVALIWPGILNLASRSDWWGDPVNWLGSFLLYGATAWIALFTIQFIFLAPFQLWRNERARNINTTSNEANNRDREVVEHDKKLAAEIRELFPESQKQKLCSDLLNQHAYWNAQSHFLIDATHFLASAEAHFLDTVLQRRAKDFVEASDKLLEFIGLKFFIYPSDQRDSPLRFAMQPNWNIDREGNGSPEQMTKYDTLTEQLEASVEKMSLAYDEMIKGFHTQLLA